MTEAQKIIEKLIASGATNSTIVAFTGKTRSYVGKVRRLLLEDPNYFKSTQVKTAIQNAKKKRTPSPNYSGDVSCLRCDAIFYSPDRRHFRICERCKSQQDFSYMETGGAIRFSSAPYYRESSTIRR